MLEILESAPDFFYAYKEERKVSKKMLTMTCVSWLLYFSSRSWMSCKFNGGFNLLSLIVYNVLVILHWYESLRLPRPGQHLILLVVLLQTWIILSLNQKPLFCCNRGTQFWPSPFCGCDECHAISCPWPCCWVTTASSLIDIDYCRFNVA